MGNIWVSYDQTDELLERFDLARGRISEIAGRENAGGEIAGGENAGGEITGGENAGGEIAGGENAGGENVVAAPYGDFFRRTAGFILYMCQVKEKLEKGYFEQHPEDWPAVNRRMYEDLLPENYGKSYADPEYAVRVLGEDYGPLLCFLCAQERGLIAYVFEDKTEELVSHMELFLQIYGMFEDRGGRAEPSLPQDLTPRAVREALYWFCSDYADVFVRNRIRGQVDPACDGPLVTLMTSDPRDISTIYKSGEYITDNEIRTFNYLASLSDEEIRKMADTFTNGYRDGFILGRKPLYKKRTVSLVYHVGFERVMQAAVRNFLKMDLRPTISRYGVSAVTGTARSQGVSGASPNPQFDYDHREDAALFLDRRFVERKVEVTQAAYDEFPEQARRYGGPAVLEVFGEHPFEPAAKKEALRYSQEQQELAVRMKNETSRIVQEAILGQERSFTIISFPLPSIDEQRYEEIFRETMKVNTLDSAHYSRIQQTLIDALDKGTRVHVLGRGGNRTDLTVALWRLKDPAKETIFENCTADVNIPVGEVFTSPVLKGTEGVLHVGQVYLGGLNFVDLELHFKDGCVTDYSCRNFENEAEDRRYIEENILFHHKTLPMGEFAIGTNTAAYRMIRKYGIGARMDILIAEKTGPHFAVGDTCYSWEEDSETYNPDGKKIVARENDFSRLRDEDPARAYFNCHTDITLPYEELGLIEVENDDGSYRKKIIENGRFVLPGTEELNESLDNDR